MRNLAKIVVVTAAVLSVAACGSTSQDATSGSGSSPSSSPAAAATGPVAGPTKAKLPECTADDVKVAGAFGVKPTITLPTTCSAPSKLLTKDLVPGTGAGAKTGDTVTANYLLETWSDKNIVDNSFDRGQTFPVQNLGQAPVIQGWNDGLIGEKKGARRLIIIPPALGYGPQGKDPVKPNETLVFVVDAVDVGPTTGSPQG
ncbi:MAG: peptidylprolyl isomerase [Amycolatopsis sp.]|uniref:FKBP-type peptidyl-prolyl cis-trans isomerase n=1 Tax=Amycolatopsis sp. TaxID=37632 RepID=UPI002611AE64|nr:FKBP-type peptidyl-prolyl cis-trans isomerase [Amycolatopsis sp.]MCU1681839.1 peptidylprolyl isomerase [Amycolatopsis sp.]